MSTSIAASLCGFIREELVGENVDVVPESDLVALGLDSFSLMSILMYIERTWEVQAPMETLTPENTATPAAIAGCVRDHLNESDLGS